MIRLHLLPPVPFVLDLADEIGLLVYEESPAGWIKESPRLAEHCRRETEEMIRRDWNHPSVVIWGLLNENVPVARGSGHRNCSPSRPGSIRPASPSTIPAARAPIDQYFAWADRCQYFLPGQGIVPAIDLHRLPEPGGADRLLLVGQARRSGKARRIRWPNRLRTAGRSGAASAASLSSWAGGIFVSEYGFGGCEDLAASAAIVPRWGGRPG